MNKIGTLFDEGEELTNKEIKKREEEKKKRARYNC